VHIIVTLLVPAVTSGFGEKLHVGGSVAPDGSENSEAESVTEFVPAAREIPSIDWPEAPGAVITAAVPDVLFGDDVNENADPVVAVIVVTAPAAGAV
jgi:hypothetical protein